MPRPAVFAASAESTASVQAATASPALLSRRQACSLAGLAALALPAASLFSPSPAQADAAAEPDAAQPDADAAQPGTQNALDATDAQDAAEGADRLTASAVPERNAIDPAYTWDLSALCADDADFDARLPGALQLCEELASYEGRAFSSGQALLAFLQLFNDAYAEVSDLYGYAVCRLDEDTRVAASQQRKGQALNLLSQFNAAVAWYDAEVGALSDDAVEALFAACPELQTYRRMVDRSRATSDHTLSSVEEALLAKARDMAYLPENAYAYLCGADLTFADAVDSQGTAHPVSGALYSMLRESPDRTLRQSAFESYYTAYSSHINVLTALLDGQMRQLKFFSDARGYASSMEAALAPNEVPAEIYGNLIEAIHAGIEPLHRYISLRKRLLGLDELHYWDLHVPVTPEVAMEYTFDEACAVMLQALAPLGEDYLQIVRTAIEQRWYDVYPNAGKASGAYSTNGPSDHPVILLNFTGRLDDLFTLVHETGHTVNSYLSAQSQLPYISEYTIFTAEVASTCNEDLLMHWLLQNVDENDPQRDIKRAYLINHYLFNIRTTLYRQAMFAEFELKASEQLAQNGGLSADWLCATYRDLVEFYHGPDLVCDELVGVEWAYVPHFYNNFYVYQYATGISAAISLSNRIRTEGAPAVEDYLGFLAAGASKPPVELLRDAGVDMSTPAPINDAVELFAELVDELEELMG